MARDWYCLRFHGERACGGAVTHEVCKSCGTLLPMKRGWRIEDENEGPMCDRCLGGSVPELLLARDVANSTHELALACDVMATRGVGKF